MASKLEWAEKIRSAVKNPSQRSAAGFLAEMEVFNKLEAAGVPFVRSK
jgi:hypothetical protein